MTLIAANARFDLDSADCHISADRKSDDIQLADRLNSVIVDDKA